MSISPVSGTAPLRVDLKSNSPKGHIFSWNFGTGDYDTTRNPSYTYQTPGKYALVLKSLDKMGYCSFEERIDNAITVFPTGLDGFGAPGLALYPNPSGSVFNIWIGSGAGFSYLRVFDIAGRMVESASLTANQLNSFGLHLPAGLYQVVLSDKQGNTTTQLVAKK
jgi:hypothetical protein